MSEDVNRRDALKAAVAGTAAVALTAQLAEHQPAEAARFTMQLPPNVERQLVIQCGFTAQEANAWVLASQLGNALLTMQNLSPEDTAEFTRLIQGIQTRLMSRPSNRQYGQLRAQIGQ